MSVLQPADLAAALAGCSQLTQLYPTGVEVPLELARADPPSLFRLYLRDSRGVTDSTLAGLPASLRYLTITGEQRQHVQAVDTRTAYYH